MPPAKVSETVQAPTVKVDGSPVAKKVMDDLLDLRVASSVHAAAMARLRFEDATFTHLDADTFQVGSALVVSLPTVKNTAVTVFTGEIVSVGVDQGLGGRHELVVVALDKAHRLSGKAAGTTYLNQSRSDVVSAIAKRHGLSVEAESAGAAEPYLLQTGTDYAFLWELAADVGFEWFVKEGKLVFRKRKADSGVTLNWGDDLLRFQARYSASDAAVSELTVRGWDPAQQKAITGNAASVIGAAGAVELGSDAPLAKASHTKAKGKFGKAVVVGSHSVRTAAEAQAVACSMARTLLGDAMTARGEAVGNPQLKPGTLVTVAKMGKKLSGRYYVTEVEHVFGVQRPLITRFSVSGHSPSGLGSMVAGGGGNGANEWGQTGVVIGVVTNVNDDQKQGRVKVKFPTLGDRVESTWARLALPGAGPTRGLDIRPEVNDEVVVAFDRGDTRQAIVLGCLWSAKNKPAIADAVGSDGKVVKRSLTTRLGHKIELCDGTSDAQKYVDIVLADKKTKVHVGQDKIDVIANNKAVTVKSGQGSIVIAANGDVTIKGNNVTIEAAAKLTLKGAQIEGKGSAAVKLSAGGQFEAKGAMVTVEGSGITQVKGSMLKLN